MRPKKPHKQIVESKKERKVQLVSTTLGSAKESNRQRNRVRVKVHKNRKYSPFLIVMIYKFYTMGSARQ